MEALKLKNKPARVSPSALVSVINGYKDSESYLILSANSKKLYDYYAAEIISYFGARTDLNEITQADVRKFRDKLVKAGHPVKGDCAVVFMRNLYRFANRQGLDIERNPVADIERLKGARRRGKVVAGDTQENLDGWPAWTEEEFWRFVASTTSMAARNAVMLARYTGQRVSEISLMDWDQIEPDLSEIVFQQKKTGRVLTIPVLPPLAKELRLMRLKHSSGRVIRNRNGTPMRPHALSELISDQARKLGINKSIHGLRKLMAATLAEKGASEDQIMSITGHKSSSSVRPYIKSARQRKIAHEAMALMREEMRGE